MMANHLVNGDFASGELSPWDNVAGHQPVTVVRNTDQSYYASFPIGSQIHQSTSVSNPGSLRFSTKIKVDGGSNEITGKVQVIISHQVGIGVPAYEAYSIREYSSWQTAQIDLDFGNQPALINIWLIVGPAAVGTVSMTDVSLDDIAKPQVLPSIKKVAFGLF
jgi:hypothetical protein